ncbi:MAG: DUF58 domain-containing protein [Thermoguttaceae bacterium]|nr:DUF58 domain-containing protein [Thermoguttaceae bacterium]
MFDSQTLKKFEFLSIASSRPFAGQTTGTRRNAKMGGGLEFADYRDYAFGEDLRNLDWNVYARFESLYIKRYQEEGDVPVYCFLDASRSMGATSDAPKFEYAKKVVGALGYISLSRLDSIAAFAITNRAEDYFPLARGKERFLSFARFLEPLAPYDAPTDITSAVQDALKKISKPGLAILVGDCFDPNGLDAALERLLSRKFEPIVLQIYTPEEARPTEVGDFEFVDAETGALRKLTIDERALKCYAKRFQAFLAATRESCVKRGVRYYSADTRVPFDSLLLDVARDINVGR